MHDDPSNRPGADDDSTRKAEQDLKATADAIRSDIGRLAAIEDEKLVLDAGDTRVDQLSDEAVALADRISRETRAERQLSHEIG
ncbi:MAG: hypothetical protein ABIZ72_01760 [Candidatus Limnocylindrales bacterium]